MPDIRDHNRRAWDQQVADGNRWTVPVNRQAVQAAREGRVAIYLTPARPVPADWLGDLAGRRVLGLASGGGQQGPLLAAAGADVTVLDNSPAQLARDREVARREKLEIRTVESDMRDLPFDDGQFDLIVHPVSNTFVPDVRPVWREAARVLRSGGSLLSGFDNPVVHIFDEQAVARGKLYVAHPLPWSSVPGLTAAERQQHFEAGRPLEFGHTLTDLIGGQLEEGLVIVGFYEDRYPPEDNDLLSRYLSTFMATWAVKRSLGGGRCSAGRSAENERACGDGRDPA
ncbi:MAG: class I SAM-dependent methyltransferase [Planctomycetota bacterium]